jgi:hypothetical protein
VLLREGGCRENCSGWRLSESGKGGQAKIHFKRRVGALGGRREVKGSGEGLRETYHVASIKEARHCKL